MAFTSNDYTAIRTGINNSAATIVPDIIKIVRPATVVDFGCGEGRWLAEFARHGATVAGYDGHPGDNLVIPDDTYHRTDLATATIDLTETYDLALCLEVAEHLPSHRADWLINLLCTAAKTILFSAAIPGQGGLNHINEQWPDYWQARFADHNYQMSGALRWLWWDRVPLPVESWYAQNIMLCVETSELKARPELQPLFDGPGCQPHAVVHPITWLHR